MLDKTKSIPSTEIPGQSLYDLLQDQLATDSKNYQGSPIRFQYSDKANKSHDFNAMQINEMEFGEKQCKTFSLTDLSQVIAL